MADASSFEVKVISAGELEEVLRRARDEGWEKLALWPRSRKRTPEREAELLEDGWRLYYLCETVAGLAERLCSLTSLTSLDLSDMGIEPEGACALATLTQLTSLDLGYNRIGDEGARALAALTSLTSLELEGAEVGAEGARALASLTSLTLLDLEGNSLRAEGARALASLTNLTSLNLKDNNLGDEGACELASLTKLNSLDLWNNRIGDEGARALASLTGLTSLDLRYNNLGAKGARGLASLTNLNSLDLGYCNLGHKGARELTSLTNLTSLDLRHNNIGDQGARELASLTSLTSLKLGENGIGAEGARALASLTNLTSLNLGGNGIGNKGAHELASLTSLTSLALWENKIGSEGAGALASLTSLTMLDLNDNKIGDEGARELASLTGLTSLYLGRIGLGDEVIGVLASLTNLTLLQLNNNKIGDKGARALVSLTSLNWLDLRRNHIGDQGARALLEAWEDRQAAGQVFRRLSLRGNGNLTSVLPAEALETTDALVILAAYRAFRDAADEKKLRPLNEAKLLVVGEEAVGKTSLIRYLVENVPRDPNQAKTAGAQIHERIETQTWAPAGSEVTLNIWDFGGQEIMHGTHRFFLTKRSLYLVVLEARREDDRSVYRWLKMIRNRGGDSPVIVVINKCDDETKDLRLDEKGLQREYPSIVGFVRTSCNDDEDAAAKIAALRELIAGTLADDERLKHVRDGIPESWLRVKKAVADLAREESVLKVPDFERLCAEPGEGNGDAIADHDTQWALLRLLHDLGVVVAHGLERDARAALREITLLDPNWLTYAIYRLLNSRTILDQGGEFSREQMRELLDGNCYPEKWHEFILGMMEDREIGLCFELSGTDHQRYLIPEALPTNEPDYEVWPADSLRFRYKYELLPPGLIPRFIVESHRNTAENPTRWKTGVVLKAADCPVWVRGDRDKGRIDILVAGPAGRRRAALNVVLNDLEAVHRRNPEIGAEGRVPLPGRPELDVSYAHLLDLEERRGPQYEYEPEGAGRAYRVAELLDGVRRERVVEREEFGGSQGTKIVAGDHAQITVVEGAVHGSGGETQVGTRGGEGATGSVITSWPMFSVACGIGAIVVAIVLWLIPSNEWRAIVGGLLGLGLAVTAFVLTFNPKYFYRRWLAYVIPAGLLGNALSFSLDAFVRSESAVGWLRWNGVASGFFFVAWAAVVLGLVWADVKQRR